ncbi:sigma-70 family RNA polymerase sigma factor [Kitasatospora sp. NPDC049285]|uniref:sigma-70 family RNA polymerase sigma factor n=1 Tax=Kitasatospora sp. NPDC049285 TaxID=3157096 RepID=UPI0034129E9A
MTETPPSGYDGPRLPEARTELVRAAQRGDARALDVLVADHLPLVYNLVGRALGTPADADDVVQEVMLQLVRDVRQLRDPGAFRSWLVTIALREVGRHSQARRSAPATGGSAALDADAVQLADPAADFVDLTITVLSLSGQRREAVEATRWLDADEQHLLSLWWMEVAGRLTRAELAGAMELTLPQTAVRVQRLKARLEVARAVVRALAEDPRCPGLRETLRGWNGKPDGLWRKRIAKHLRTCPVCGDEPVGLIASERLLADLALVAVPPVLLALLAPHPVDLATAGASATVDGAASHAARAGKVSAGKAVLAGAGAVALVAVLVLGYVVGLPQRHGASRAAAGAPPPATVATALAAPSSAPSDLPSATAATPDPTASTGSPSQAPGKESGTGLPVRAAFYYPWYPDNFTPGGSHYTASAGRYSVDAPATVNRQIADMQYGGLQAGIASWWGVGRREDTRLPLLMAEGARTGFSWSVYYEQEGYTDPSVAQIQSDLTHLRTFADQKAWLHVDGKPVVFVYAEGDDGCDMATRWAEANRTAGYYVVLKVFSGYRSCANQPQGWHQYSDTVDVQPGFSASLSPGFWKNDEATPRVPRDLARFRRDAETVAASGAPFQLVVTYNEWGEGTATESATAWASPSGHGAYLDILHDAFAAHPR